LNDNIEALLGTNPNLPDTDGDGLTDGDEFNLYGLDPTVLQKGDVGPRNSPDGKWSASDLLVMTQLVLGLSTTNPPESILADINQDTQINVADLLLLTDAVMNGAAP